MNFLEAFDKPFSTWRGDLDWSPWRTYLKALTATPLTDNDRPLFEQCTGRTTEFEKPPSESWLIVGRRGKKSATAAMIAVTAAAFGDWNRCLAPGEMGRVLVCAFVKEQAKLVRQYCESILRSRPDLEDLIRFTDKDSITLSTGIIIQVVASSFRSVRGPSVVCAVLDEVAAWYSTDSANPDFEVVRAIRPAMVTTRKHGAVMIGLSSPHAKKGVLWERFRDHFGNNDSRVLVWRAATEVMHPEVDRDEIARDYADDPSAASAEYGALFRDDLQSFLDAELLDKLTRSSPLELPPREGIRYFCFCDPSGGRADAMTLAISHREENRVVIDLVRAIKAPFDPAQATKEFADIAKEYRCREVTGDAYSGAWVGSAFAEHNITYKTSKLNKSQIYLETLPMFTREEIELPDHRPLLVELAQLERRTARGGKDSVDHPARCHDDMANAVCGALNLASGKKKSKPCKLADLSADNTEVSTVHEANDGYPPEGKTFHSTWL